MQSVNAKLEIQSQHCYVKSIVRAVRAVRASGVSRMVCVHLSVAFRSKKDCLSMSMSESIPAHAGDSQESSTKKKQYLIKYSK